MNLTSRLLVARRAQRHLLCLLLCVTAAISAAPALAQRSGIDIDGNGRRVLLVRSAEPVMQVGRLVSDRFQFSAQTDPGAAYRYVGATDLDGNGKSDLVFLNAAQGGSGDVMVWNDFEAASERLLRSVKTVWEVQAVGDLDGDGLGDLVWRYNVADSPDTGVSYIWFSNSSGVGQVGKRGGAPLTWTLLGAMDINGDKAADMLYIDPQGRMRVLMATPGRSCANLSAGTMPSGYAAIKFGDFTGNKRGDVLLRNMSSGQMGIVSLSAAGLVLPAPTAAPGDPNASCTSTPLQVAGTSLSLPSADPSWQFYAAADYDGDGIDDIVWRRPNGQLTLWRMKANGAAPVVVDNAGSAPEAMKAVFENGVNRVSALESSFSRIQSMFASNCNVCHTATLPTTHVVGQPHPIQSTPYLNDATAYDNLINATPKNTAAIADGLRLVVPGNSGKSLLLQKLRAWNDAAAARYGSPMPLGGNSLTLGQIEFIKRWIDTGAPRVGEVVDAGLLNDQTTPASAAFEPLPMPDRGVQLKAGPFTVAPKFERELFVYRSLGNTAPIYVSRIETKMRVNSHHQLLYTFNSSIPRALVPPLDVVRDIRNPDGTMNFFNSLPMGYHTFFAGSMTPIGGYTFPVGVALQLPANATLDVNVHYVNSGTADITGEAYANLHTVDASQVQYIAKTLDLGNTSLNLPPGQRTTATKSFTFNETTRILMLTSHMHKLGEKFVIKIRGGPRDGQIVYENTDWESPKIVTFDQPLVLSAGQGLTSEITYNNTTSLMVMFGLTSADEMGIIFGYYY